MGCLDGVRVELIAGLLVGTGIGAFVNEAVGAFVGFLDGIRVGLFVAGKSMGALVVAGTDTGADGNDKVPFRMVKNITTFGNCWPD